MIGYQRRDTDLITDAACRLIGDPRIGRFVGLPNESRLHITRRRGYATENNRRIGVGFRARHERERRARILITDTVDGRDADAVLRLRRKTGQRNRVLKKQRRADNSLSVYELDTGNDRSILHDGVGGLIGVPCYGRFVMRDTDRGRTVENLRWSRVRCLVRAHRVVCAVCRAETFRSCRSDTEVVLRIGRKPGECHGMAADDGVTKIALDTQTVR